MELWWAAAILFVLWCVAQIASSITTSPENKGESQSSESRDKVDIDPAEHTDDSPDTDEADHTSCPEASADNELSDEAWRRAQDQGVTEDRYGPGRF